MADGERMECEECGGLFPAIDVLDSMGVCKACLRTAASIAALERERDELREAMSKLWRTHEAIHAGCPHRCGSVIDDALRSEKAP